jgi:DNA segregation ATPase FtsK/SpoIIIE, S-DNA-T family
VRACASLAPQIERLSERVLLSTLPAQIDGQLVVGLSSDTLSPLGIEPQGTFLISGPAGSGRSSALLTLAQSMRRLDPTAELYHVGNPRSKMAKLPWWTGTFTGPDSADRLVTLAATLALQVTSQSTVAVFVENIAELASTAAEAALTDLIKLCLAENWLFVAEGETSTLSGSYGLLALAKSSRAGLALQPDSGDGITIFRTPFPSRLNRADFPPGRALLVGRGTTSVVQVGLPEDS